MPGKKRRPESATGEAHVKIDVSVVVINQAVVLFDVAANQSDARARGWSLMSAAKPGCDTTLLSGVWSFAVVGRVGVEHSIGSIDLDAEIATIKTRIAIS